MSEQLHDQATPESSDVKQATDSELSLRAILIFTVSIALIIGAAIGGMYFYSMTLSAQGAASDPPLPALPEARQNVEPPEPRLQSNPRAELAAFHAAEEAELTTWGWVDEAGGVARIPVAEAMQILAEHGFDAGRDPAETSADPAAGPETETAEP